MKTWRWFVGQVARLRRSIVGVFPLAVQRRRPADDLDVADEPAAGPPEHWVERVRRGAPGLLEPSLRQETAGPQDRVPSQAELEPVSDAPAAPDRERLAPEPRISTPPPEPPARARLVPKVLRRRRLPPAVSTSPVERPPAPAAEHPARELHTATRRVTETAGSAPREQQDSRRPVEEPEQTAPSVAEEPERLPQPSEVVELKAHAQERAAPAERTAGPEAIRADFARPTVAAPRQAELAVEELRADPRRAVPAPAPRRETSLERPPEPTIRAPRPPLQPAPTRASHAEPLPVVELPWPELPPALDRADDDEVEAALRTWEHRRRIDHEQTRL